ncbi:MAG: type IX secretion system membrane protein PorP/SprF [Cyclobacteriaceae bacterium]|nr:type IX secretion system membrane protein PorP/SprF [Cyclobacteriaceae bacterium]
MDHRIRLVIFIVLMLAGGNSRGQDPQFSQFYAAPLYLNPAFAGSTQITRVGMNYRNQWPAIDASYVTYTAYADHFFVDVNSGVGLLIISDREGLAGLRNQGASLFYAYQLPVSGSWTFRAGGQAGYYFRDLDYSKLVFGDMILPDGTIVPGGENLDNFADANYLDLSFGGLMYNNKVWVGFTGHHVNTPNRSFLQDGSDPLPVRYSVHAGYRLNLRPGASGQILGGNVQRSIDLYPAVNYRVQGEYMQFDAGAYLDFQPVIFGVWYRGIPFRKVNDISNNESVIFSVGFSKNNLNLGYSFDYTLSQLGIQSGGAHEVSISYEFFIGNPRKPPRSIREIPCPKL